MAARRCCYSLVSERRREGLRKSENTERCQPRNLDQIQPKEGLRAFQGEEVLPVDVDILQLSCCLRDGQQLLASNCAAIGLFCHQDQSLDGGTQLCRLLHLVMYVLVPWL